MTTGTLMPTVRRIAADLLGIHPEAVIETATWDELGADSLDTVELAMAFEDEFGIELTDDAVSVGATVRQTLDAILAGQVRTATPPRHPATNIGA